MNEQNMEMEVVKPQGDALVEVEQSRAISETQAAMIIAKRFRRDTVDCLDRIVNSCTRPGLAEAALYEYSRGGTAITGPSIRLAEAIAQNWGNLQFGIRELEQRNGESTVEAYAWDVETNTKQLKTFQVAHKRHTKRGAYRLEDPRDIYEMVANQGARRLRACILGIIPGDVVEAAVKQCEATLKSKAEVTPERIKNLVEKFAEYNVTKAQLEKRVQKHIDAITPAQMINLGKIYNSLKDGMSAPADWFEVEEKPSASDSLKEKLKAKPPEPAKAEEPPAPPTETQEQEEQEPQINIIEWLTVARPSTSTTNAETWLAEFELHKDEINALDEKQRTQLYNKLAKTKAYLEKQNPPDSEKPPATKINSICEKCGESKTLANGHLCRDCFEQEAGEQFREENGINEEKEELTFERWLEKYAEYKDLLGAEWCQEILVDEGYNSGTPLSVKDPEKWESILKKFSSELDKRNSA